MELVKITRESGIPLIGHIAFGIIDRGSNLLQVRATTVCNLHCTFCSTAAGPELHPVNFEVDKEYLVEWIKEAIRLKGREDIEMNIDSAGEPTAYPHLVDLVKKVRGLPEVKVVSMQTNGSLLGENKIKELEDAGLDRINLSIHAVDEDVAKYLMGSPYYNLKKIKDIVKIIAKTSIELNLTPVWLPGVNDNEIPKLILLAKELKCKISIQKYEMYKYSRKEKKAERISWFKFYRRLEVWEKEFGMKLKVGPSDFRIVGAKKIPLVFERGEIAHVVVKAPGWMRNEVVAVGKNRVVSVLDTRAAVGDRIKVKIIETQNSIYLAKRV